MILLWYYSPVSCLKLFTHDAYTVQLRAVYTATRAVRDRWAPLTLCTDQAVRQRDQVESVNFMIYPAGPFDSDR